MVGTETASSSAVLMDGKATALAIRRELASKVEARILAGLAQPGLGVIIVGTRADSQSYVRGKKKACEEAGYAFFLNEMSSDITQEELETAIDGLNARDDVHGILVQLPLPKHLDEESALARISLPKDVDGFHPLNIGALCMSGRTPPMAIPCTPKGVIELLDRYGVTLEGASAVVLGRSNIVGMPVAMLLQQRNSTVTICHSRTRDVAERVRGADIVVAACGIASYVKGDWLKPGAVVVDVGINAVDDATKKKGYRLVGDVDAEGADAVASLRTPVPGGVGPMTIAMLLTNTLDACERCDSKPEP